MMRGRGMATAAILAGLVCSAAIFSQQPLRDRQRLRW